MTATPGPAPWGTTRRATVARDGRAMTVLRAVAYVTTTLASVLFIVLVIAGMVLFSRFQSAVSGGFPRLPLPTSQPSYQAPTPEQLNQGDPSGKTQFCFANPNDPICANAN
jgi:hypothetical protein